MNDLLRHTIATLAYRTEKALRDAPDEFADYAAGAKTRTPVQIVAHIGDLLTWALTLCDGAHRWHNSTPLPWPAAVARLYSGLARLDQRVASDEPLRCTPEALFQGPIADALTHVGQLTLLRRMASAPVRGENYFRAEIVAGRVGPDQSHQRVEFD